jgi:hypothetical protein
MKQDFSDDDYPALYGAANEFSAASQGQFFRALAANLALLVAAATMSVINLPEVWFALLQAAILLASLALTIFLAAKKPQRSWYGARALAESVKTVTWRYMMRAEPFKGSEEAADKQLAKTLFNILEANKHISSQATQILTVHQSTPRMREIRSLNLPDRKSFYEKRRIEDQRGWYISKCQENDKKSSFWFSVLIAVNALAIVFALLRALFPSAQNWPTDIFVAASGSLMAWLQTKRFQELAASYTLAAHEIGLFRLGLGHIQDEKALSDFVGDAENAFSREHTQWQARRDAI